MATRVLRRAALAVMLWRGVEPMTGYGLGAAISDTLGHFWHESFGRIYPTLTALEAAGFVRRVGTKGSGPLHLTATGETRLQALLAQPFSPTPARDPLLLRLFFGRHVAPELTRDRLMQALEASERHSQEFGRIRAGIEEEPASADTIYWLITLSAGEHAARARMVWAREALELFDRRSLGGAARTGAVG